MSGRRHFAVEVIQSSAMDCGPAALKCLAEGFGLPVSYGRLREACQTSVDGTSIDTLEEVAKHLGLDAEQVIMPAEHLLQTVADALPAIVVVSLPSGLLHFIVVWRVHGKWVQVMDPARGRRWIRRNDLVRQLYIHELTLPLEGVADWLASEGFLDPLRRRLHALEGEEGVQALADVTARHDWQGVAALDAAARATEEAGAEIRLPTSASRELFRRLRTTKEEGNLPLKDSFATVLPLAGEAWPRDKQGSVRLRGTVLIRVQGRQNRDPEAAPVPESLARARAEKPERPGRTLLAMLVGRDRPQGGALAVVLAATALGTVAQALLFRSLLDVGQRLQLFAQRAAFLGMVGGLLVAILLLDLSAARSLGSAGRRIERRLRESFLRKIPRLRDLYFRSRPQSDMVERAHLGHRLRGFPVLAGHLFRTLCELVLTTAGLVWLAPSHGWLALLLAGAAVAIPLAFQPALAERDLRMRTHAGGLARFYLDALLGLMPIRSHGAEGNLIREHENRLVEWIRAAAAAAKTAVCAEATQSVLGFGGAAVYVLVHLRSSAGSGWTLLLVYWALQLPALGQELGFLLQQLPGQKNVALRLLEPLGTPEGDAADQLDDVAAPPAGGMAIHAAGAVVVVAGREVLAIPQLDIAAGEHLAIVGRSGSGKSTLAALLVGLQEVASGEWLVDGAPATGSALARLRDDTIWIDASSYLWNHPLLVNVQFGRNDGRGRLVEALEESELDDVILNLPAGLATAIGEGGALLSGGQAQRVRAARAIHRGRARLVILDEALRGLEAGLRVRLLERMRRRWAQATFLYITHDLEEAATFGRVLVIEAGQIAEDGAPASLSQAVGSRFASLLHAHGRMRERLRSSMTRTFHMVEGRLKEEPITGRGHLGA